MNFSPLAPGTELKKGTVLMGNLRGIGEVTYTILNNGRKVKSGRKYKMQANGEHGQSYGCAFIPTAENIKASNMHIADGAIK